MCAIKLPHTNILTFHTILNVYYHGEENIVLTSFLVVAIHTNKQSYKFLLCSYKWKVICMGEEATYSRLRHGYTHIDAKFHTYIASFILYADFHFCSKRN